jgi:SAM-dependent methyltransferase
MTQPAAANRAAIVLVSTQPTFAQRYARCVGDDQASVDFDRAAEFYDATRGLADATMAQTVNLVAGELAGRGRVLEIGVGTGLLALPLSSRGVDVVGIDLSEPMLRQLIHKAGGQVPFPVLRADATRLPFPADSFGGAYVRHVLHLIPRWKVAVEELCRVVHRGVVLVEAGGDSGDGWSALFEAVDAAVGSVHGHVGLDMAGDGIAELDAAFIEAGATPRELPEIAYEDHDTIAAYVAEVERRSPSWTWRATDEQVRATAAAVRDHAMARYGTLDVRPDETAHVRWRAFDLTG